MTIIKLYQYRNRMFFSHVGLERSPMEEQKIKNVVKTFLKERENPERRLYYVLDKDKDPKLKDPKLNKDLKILYEDEKTD